MLDNVCSFEAMLHSDVPFIVMTFIYSQERQTIEILLYADGDLLVSGFVVLTSGTSVPTFTFIHFTSPTSFYGFSGLSDCRPLLTQSLSCWCPSTKRIFLRDTLARSNPRHILGHTFRSIPSGSFLSSFVCPISSSGITF